MIYVANAFSLQMLNMEKVNTVISSPLTIEEVKEVLSNNEFTSSIGHPDTANVLTSLLGVNIPYNRINVTLTPGDVLIVAQLTGGRLPENCSTLPNGFNFKFVKVVLVTEL